MRADYVSVAFREDERNPAHVTVSVFVGRNEGSRGHAGQITVRADEWDELVTALSLLGTPRSQILRTE